MFDLRDLYQEVILDHNKRPRNFGQLAAPDRTSEGFNPPSGDKPTSQLELDGDVIRDVAFDAPKRPPGGELLKKIARHRLWVDTQGVQGERAVLANADLSHSDLAGVDLSAAEAMPGVTTVHDGEFVGVAAPTEERARAAIAAIRADWNTTPQVGQRELFDHLKATAAGEQRAGGRGPSRETGSSTAGLAPAGKTLAHN